MAEAEEETRNEESRDQTPRPETDAERDAEAATPQTATSNQDGKLSENKDEAYSIFTTPQKRAIVCTASLCAFFSPITATIYFPALNVIAHDLGVSNSDINLTVTTYLIFQGIAPTFIAGFSDSAGRRPAYCIAFVLYIAANIGLGAQNSYAALITLRCLQSAGSSGTVALASGIAADVVSSAERGSYVAISAMGALVGPVIGPIIGGLISQFVDWHWIFWFLAIMAGVVFVPLMLFFPETNRKVVGDGSYPPPPQCKSVTSAMIARRLERKGIQLDPEKKQQLQSDYKVQFPNPFATLVIAYDKGCFIILLGGGLVLLQLYITMTGVASLFAGIYGFNEIQIALCFIPLGVGAILSSFMVGRLMDLNFRRHATRLGIPVVKNRRHDLENFPIERARLEIAVPMLYACMGLLIAYGWVLQAQTNLAGPLVLLFFIGVTNSGAFQVMNTLIVDYYPAKAATAAAASNLFRCLLGAGATAVLGPMLDAWGVGWTYTFWAVLWIVFSPALALLVKYGPEWRRARAEKVKAKKEKKESAREEKESKRSV